MKKTPAVYFALLIGALCIFAIRYTNKTKTYSADLFALDTYINLQINTKNDGKAILEEAKSKIRHLEQLFSHTDENSDISRINSHAGDGIFVQVSPETIEILQISKTLCADSAGAFDITIAPLVDLWNITAENPTVPSSANIQSAAALADINSIIIDTATQSVRLENPDQAITLGAVAKGYIADELVELLKSYNVQSAILNLGGNTVTIGTKPDDASWKIGIQNPDNAEKILGTLSVADKCVITSGDYERFFIADGVRYHHIIDPKTGYPAKNGLRSVTIIGDNSTIADSLSTACFILGKDKSIPLLAKHNCAAIFCDSDINITVIGDVEFEENQNS